MKQFFVTFGTTPDHQHEIGTQTTHSRTIVMIERDDYGTARERAFEMFGRNFAFIYSEDDFDMNQFPGHYIISDPKNDDRT